MEKLYRVKVKRDCRIRMFGELRDLKKDQIVKTTSEGVLLLLREDITYPPMDGVTPPMPFVVRPASQDRG